jgi:hypothetical protein
VTTQSNMPAGMPESIAVDDALPASQPTVGRSRNPDERQRIQLAIDRLVAGTASDDDIVTLTDRGPMGVATGDQACAIIKALAKMGGTPPAWATEVLWAAAVILSIRWGQSPHRRPPTADANGRRKFRGPDWSQREVPEQLDEQDAEAEVPTGNDAETEVETQGA